MTVGDGSWPVVPLYPVQTGNVWSFKTQPYMALNFTCACMHSPHIPQVIDQLWNCASSFSTLHVPVWAVFVYTCVHLRVLFSVCGGVRECVLIFKRKITEDCTSLCVSLSILKTFVDLHAEKNKTQAFSEWKRKVKVKEYSREAYLSLQAIKVFVRVYFYDTRQTDYTIHSFSLRETRN